MKLGALGSDFKKYLKSKGLDKEASKADKSGKSGILQNTKEFKSFLEDELNYDTSLFAKSLNDAKNLQMVDGKLSVKEDTKNESDESDLEELDMFSEVMNELLEDDDFKEVVDTDGDGEITDEEMSAFFEAAAQNDENADEISFEDIIGTADKIKSGDFKIESKEDKIEQTQAASSSGGVGGAGGYGGGVGGVGGANSAPAEKTLDNMTKEELQAELSSEQATLDSHQTDLKSIADGSCAELQALQGEIDSAYDVYQEALEQVDEEMAKQVDDKKQEIDDKQTEINDKECEIIDQKQAVTDAENTYNNAVSRTKNLEEILNALKSADTSSDKEKADAVAAKISQVEAQIAQAKIAEDNAKKALDEAKEKQTTLEGQKADLEAQLNTLNDEMAELEAEIAEKYPEVKEKMDAWNELKESYNEQKAQLSDKVNQEITKSQEKIAEINTALQNVENKNDVKEYGFSAFGDDILEFAEQFLGCNEADGSANKFLNGASSASIPWCAAFVEYVMENGGSWDSVPDWYKNIDNKWYCPNVYNAASSANAIISAQEAQPGDIVLFDWDGDGVKDHIGIIKSTDGGKVVTVEGNTSNQVANREYEIGDGRLTYCRVAS